MNKIIRQEVVFGEKFHQSFGEMLRQDVAFARIVTNKLSQRISLFHSQKKCTITWHTQWSYTSDLSLPLSHAFSHNHTFGSDRNLLYTAISLSLTHLGTCTHTHTFSLSLFFQASLSCPLWQRGIQKATLIFDGEKFQSDLI